MEANDLAGRWVACRTAMLAALLAVFAVDAAGQRLQVEVVPVTVRAWQYWKDDPRPLVGPRADPTVALQATLGAMRLLRVPASRYDVVLSEESIPELHCEYPGTVASRTLPGDDMACAIDDDGDGTVEILAGGRILSLARDRINLMEERGRVVVAVLALPPDLSWWGIYGHTQYWYWDEDRNQHHTDRSCSVWAISSDTALAHQLGYCFGLLPHGSDSNLVGPEDVIDLMHPNTHLLMRHLRPSNVARVRSWFRTLPPAVGAEVRRPRAQAGTPGAAVAGGRIGSP